MLTTKTEYMSHSAALELDTLTDADSFAALVDRYKDRIVNYLTRLTGQRERAEDIAQETFVRFYQHRHKYREEGALTAYLFRIATNLVRSEDRRQRRWRLLEPVFSRGGRSPDGVQTVEQPAQPSPQREVLAAEEIRQVTRAIAELDILHRAPLVLREIEGLSYREIAQVLDLSEGTVKSRLHKARELLKQKLVPYWHGDA